MRFRHRGCRHAQLFVSLSWADDAVVESNIRGAFVELAQFEPGHVIPSITACPRCPRYEIYGLAGRTWLKDFVRLLSFGLSCDIPCLRFSLWG